MNPWRERCYIGHDPKQFRQYGPVAQEFFGAFGHDAIGTIGTSTTINSGDMEGILMVAVQALERRTSELATLKAENADLKARLENWSAPSALLWSRLNKFAVNLNKELNGCVTPTGNDSVTLTNFTRW